MRLHTDLLTESYIRDAISRIGALDRKHQPVAIGGLTTHGSRTKAKAFELQISGSSVTGGQYGSADFRTATWDEWGTVLGLLYAIDPEMIVGSPGKPVYENRYDFNLATFWRFYQGKPDDPCLRHKWNHERPSACVRCSAER